jgi:hypothetical protein
MKGEKMVRRDESSGSSDTDTITYRTTDDEPSSESVLGAVADVTGTDPTDMDPLYDVINPDALDELFGRSIDRDQQSPLDYVLFHFEGCAVAVHADRRIEVTPTESAHP